MGGDARNDLRLDPGAELARLDRIIVDLGVTFDHLEALDLLDDGVAPLEPLLDRRPIEPLVEYLGRRLGLIEGHRQMLFSLHNGGLQETRLPTGPIKNRELERLAGSPIGRTS